MGKKEILDINKQHKELAIKIRFLREIQKITNQDSIKNKAVIEGINIEQLELTRSYLYTQNKG